MWNVSLIDRQPMFALRQLFALVSLSLALSLSLSLARLLSLALALSRFYRVSWEPPHDPDPALE
jgi:hypothetical protein